MFKWLRKLLGNEYENLAKQDVRKSEIYLSTPPIRTDYTSDRSERSASAKTVQPREQMKRASSPPPSRRRNDNTPTVYTDNSPLIHTHQTSGSNHAPVADTAIKSGGGGDFGGGGASGGWGSGSCNTGGGGYSDGGGGGCGGGDGGGGGGDCHADFAHDTIVAKLNRRAGARTLFIP